MTKDTIKIDLPPPPPSRKSGRARNRGLVVFVILALIAGIVGGYLAAQHFGITKAQPGGNSPKIEEITPEALTEIDELMLKARSAISNREWLEARNLYQQVLNRDPKNSEANIANAIVEQHLDGARGGLKITTNPPGATVKIGRLEKTTPFEAEKLAIGTHKLVISKDGYQNLERAVTIEEGETLELGDIALVKTAGSVEVVSVPEGAEYKIVKDTPSGEQPKEFIKIGKTPAKLEEMEPGDYKIFVEMDGWPVYTEIFRVKDNQNSSVSAVFANKAQNVKSDPSGAEVWVKLEGESEFKKYGETPIALKDLPFGLHKIETRYQNWQPIRRTVKLLPNVTPELIDIKWKRAMVRLDSDPPGAEIYHFNQRLGGETDVTPFSTELPAGDYLLTATHELLDNAETNLLVTGDETNTVQAQFEFEYGSVSIETDPPGAGIVLNGKPGGQTPKVFSVLRPGKYNFELNKTGYRTAKVSGEVENGSELKFNPKLKYDPTPRQRTNFTNTYGDEFVWVSAVGGWVGVHEVNQKTYEAVMNENPSQFEGDKLPVDSVSWYDATKFTERITQAENSRKALPNGFAYKLPTDKQWSIFAGKQGLEEAVTSIDSRREGTARIGSLRPNEFGLYDVRGNVWEWCQDWYSPTVMDRARKDGAAVNSGWSGTDRKVLRGGSWNRSSEGDLKLGYRLGVRQGTEGRYDVGFRLVIVPDR